MGGEDEEVGRQSEWTKYISLKKRREKENYFFIKKTKKTLKSSTNSS